MIVRRSLEGNLIEVLDDLPHGTVPVNFVGDLYFSVVPDEDSGGFRLVPL